MASSSNDKKALSQRNEIYRLFSEHAIYTKLYLNSAIDDSADLAAITARLLQNQASLAAVLRPYLGTDKTERFDAALKEQLLATAKVVAATKEKNSAKLEEATEELFLKGELLAAVIVSFNESVLSGLTLRAQTQYLLDIITLRSENKYEDEIKVYDIYYAAFLKMSRRITEAVFAVPNSSKINLLEVIFMLVAAALVLYLFIYAFNCARPLHSQIRLFPLGKSTTFA